MNLTKTLNVPVFPDSMSVPYVLIVTFSNSFQSAHFWKCVGTLGSIVMYIIIWLVTGDLISIAAKNSEEFDLQ